MPDLIWTCSKCGGSNDRMEAVAGRKRFWLFGARKSELIAICLDCWSEMEFVGPFDQTKYRGDKYLKGWGVEVWS